MNKIILGQKPATFKAFPVKFPMPDGSEGKISVTYLYNTKTDWAKLYDKHLGGTVERNDVADGEKKPGLFEGLVAGDLDRKVSFLLESIKSWDLAEHELSRQTLLQLGDELPAAIDALVVSYGAACQQGRLGN